MAKKRIKKIPTTRPDAERRLRQSDRLARVFRVLQLIQSRGRYSAKEIAAEIECSERTVYRDLQVLLMAGVPYYFSEEENCYRIRPGWQFPVLNLTPDELLGQAIAGAISKAPGLDVSRGAKAASTKLAAKSSEQTARILTDAAQLVAVLDLKLADHSRHHEALKTIQWALLERKQLAGHYISPYQERPVTLTLDPYRLCLVHQAWYLIARPASSKDPRTYRAMRFKSLRMLDAPAEVPEDFDLPGYFGNAWGVFRGKEAFDVAVQFTKDAAAIVRETKWHPTQKAKEHPDGTVTLSFRVDGLEEIVWWVLGWSGRAKVVKPEKLRTMVLEKLQSAIELNGGEL